MDENYMDEGSLHKSSFMQHYTKEDVMLEFHMDDIGGSFSYSLTPTKHAQLLPFHLLDIGTFHMGDSYFTRRIGLNNFLLIITTDGCGKLHWKEQSCQLSAASAVLIDCNTYHEYRTIPRHTWSFDFLHFGVLSIEGYQDILLENLTPIQLRSPTQMKKLFEELRQLSSTNSVVGNAVMSHLISSMLTELVGSLAEGMESSHNLNYRDIAALAEFIRKNFVEDLHIDDFMKITNLSRHYLIHTFEKQIGMSPYRYLHMCRINYAQKLLTTTDMSISEIAYSVGYHAPAVFIRHFKSFHGVSPGAYRSSSVRMV